MSRADPLPGHLSRAEAIRRLRPWGATANKLREWERRKGWINRAKKVKGAVYYRTDDVAALERHLEELGRSTHWQTARVRRRGELARRAFALFKRGLSIADVVIELGEPPEVIAELRARFSADDLIVSGPLRFEVSRLADELGRADPMTGAELVALVRVLVDHMHACELARIARATSAGRRIATR